jgi:hypothetical protein
MEELLSSETCVAVYQSTRRNTTEAQKTPLQITFTYLIGMSLWGKLNNVKHNVGPGLHIGLLIWTVSLTDLQFQSIQQTHAVEKPRKVTTTSVKLVLCAVRPFSFLEWFIRFRRVPWKEARLSRKGEFVVFFWYGVGLLRAHSGNTSTAVPTTEVAHHCLKALTPVTADVALPVNLSFKDELGTECQTRLLNLV